MKLIGIGDNVCDKYVHLKTMFPGGQSLNAAVYAKMLGVDSAYIGVFGTDKVAEHVMNTLDEIGVDRSRCRQYKGENGYAKVDLVDGDRVFLGSNKGGVLKEYPIELTKEDEDYIKQFDIVHTSNNSYFDSQLSKVAKTGVTLSYDFSGQWVDKDRVARVAPYVDFAFLSCGPVSEEEGKNICQGMKDLGFKIIVATRGSLGAMLYDGKNYYLQPARTVEAIDTLGAGDSFATAFLLSFLKSMKGKIRRIKQDDEYYQNELKKAMEKGAQFASKTCMARGAFGYGIAY